MNEEKILSKNLFDGNLSGGNCRRGRVVDDFYATSPKDTYNFLRELDNDGVALLENKGANCRILEPCAGAGHIVDVLKEEYPLAEIEYTDIISRREDVRGEVDFLDESNYTVSGVYDLVLTNPPFKLAKEFINKSLELSSRYVCIFAKLSFLEGKGRLNWWRAEVPLKYVYVYSYRANPLRNGEEFDENGKRLSSVMQFAWYIFEKGYEGEPTIRWISDNIGKS